MVGSTPTQNIKGDVYNRTTCWFSTQRDGNPFQLTYDLCPLPANARDFMTPWLAILGKLREGGQDTLVDDADHAAAVHVGPVYGRVGGGWGGDAEGCEHVFWGVHVEALGWEARTGLGHSGSLRHDRE